MRFLPFLGRERASPAVRIPIWATREFRWLVGILFLLCAVLGVAAWEILPLLRGRGGMDAREAQAPPQVLKAIGDASLLSQLEGIEDSTPIEEPDAPYFALLDSLTKLKAEDLRRDSRRIAYAQLFKAPSRFRARVVRVMAMFAESKLIALALDRKVADVEFVHRAYLVDPSGNEGYVVDLIEAPPPIERRTLIETDAVFLKIGTYEGLKGPVEAPFFLARQLRWIQEKPATKTLESHHTVAAAAVVLALGLLALTLLIYYQARSKRRGLYRVSAARLPPQGRGLLPPRKQANEPGALAAAAPAPRIRGPRWKLGRRRHGGGEVAPQLSGRQRHLLRLLMLSCILALLGRLGWNSYQRYLARTGSAVALSAALEVAETAAGQIYTVESKAWLQGQNLRPEDFAAIRSSRQKLQAGVVGAQDTLELIRRHDPGLQAPGLADATRKVLELKLRLVDAEDLAESEGKAESGGFFIPLHKTMAWWRAAEGKLAELEKSARPGSTGSGEAPQPPAGALEEAREIDKVLGEAEASLTRLEAYVKEGLAREDLTAEHLSELGLLTSELKLVGEARKRAQRFPLRD